MIVNNNEIHHICVGTRQQDTLKTVKQYTTGGKGRGRTVEEVILMEAQYI
jgi:hypothetical protein